MFIMSKRLIECRISLKKTSYNVSCHYNNLLIQALLCKITVIIKTKPCIFYVFKDDIGK